MFSVVLGKGVLLSVNDGKSKIILLECGQVHYYILRLPLATILFHLTIITPPLLLSLAVVITVPSTILTPRTILTSRTVASDPPCDDRPSCHINPPCDTVTPLFLPFPPLRLPFNGAFYPVSTVTPWCGPSLHCTLAPLPLPLSWFPHSLYYHSPSRQQVGRTCGFSRRDSSGWVGGEVHTYGG